MNDVVSIVAPLLTGVGVVGAVVAVVWMAYRERRRFVEAFAGDREVRARVDKTGHVSLTTIGELRHAELTIAVPPGKVPTWSVRVLSPAFASRTSLKITREGVVGFLRERVFGAHDIHVGDALVDDTLDIRGSDPAVVRALFARSDVKQALVPFFKSEGAESIEVYENGTCLVRVARPSSVTPQSVRAIFVRAAEIVSLLDGAASDIPALPPSAGVDDVVPEAGVSASASPIAVPIDLGRAR